MGGIGRKRGKNDTVTDVGKEKEREEKSRMRRGGKLSWVKKKTNNARIGERRRELRRGEEEANKARMGEGRREVRGEREEANRARIGKGRRGARREREEANKTRIGEGRRKPRRERERRRIKQQEKGEGNR